MTTTLIPFDYSGRQVRTVTRDGEPWFVAADVCAVLTLRDASSALKMVDEEDKQRLRRSDTPQFFGGIAPQVQELWLVNESGIYALIFQSNKTEARQFKRWVTHEVLPAIRKTGRYEVAVPKSLPEALRAYANEVEAHEATRAELVLVKPRAESWDVLADTGSDFSVREAAYILNRDPAINTGERRLFGVLRTWGLIDSRDRPYANHSTHVTLRPRTRTDRRTQEEVPAKPQVRVTVAGLTYLHKRMGGSQPLNLDIPA